MFGEKKCYECLVQLLLDLDCDVNNADKSGWTALYHAAFGGEVGEGLKGSKNQMW